MAPISITDIVKAAGSYDLQGQTVTGGHLRGITVEIFNGSITGELKLQDCHGSHIHDLAISAPPDVKLQSLLNNLGSDYTLFEDVRLTGGRCAGQLHVGQSSYDTAGTPRNWVARRIHCAGNQLWGEYPQGHCTYINTRPDVNMNALVEDCVFEQSSGCGHVHKIGSTANNPWFEGTNGLLTRRCRIVSAPGPDRRALPIVVQGAGTKNIFFDDVTCEMVHSPISTGEKWELVPSMMHVITVVQGGRAEMTNVKFPKGALQSVEKVNQVLFYKWFTTKKQVAPANDGGLRWYFT